MLFHLSSEASGKDTHAGVLEFIAEEGRVYIPRWMMQSLLLNEGDIIMVKSITLPLGKFVRIQPQSVDFLDIYDPKAVLENAFRGFSTLTEGDIISISYNDKQYDILIMEVKPARAVSIIETDLEVDFAPPLGYQEPKYTPKTSMGHATIHGEHASIKKEVLSQVRQEQAKEKQAKLGWNSLGTGQKLNGKSSEKSENSSVANVTASTSISNDQAMDMENIESKAALRLPPGKLFFGFNTQPYESEETVKDKGKDKAVPVPTLGTGQTLRAARKAAGKNSGTPGENKE